MPTTRTELSPLGWLSGCTLAGVLIAFVLFSGPTALHLDGTVTSNSGDVQYYHAVRTLAAALTGAIVGLVIDVFVSAVKSKGQFRLSTVMKFIAAVALLISVVGLACEWWSV